MTAVLFTQYSLGPDESQLYLKMISVIKSSGLAGEERIMNGRIMNKKQDPGENHSCEVSLGL